MLTLHPVLCDFATEPVKALDVSMGRYELPCSLLTQLDMMQRLMSQNILRVQWSRAAQTHNAYMK